MITSNKPIRDFKLTQKTCKDLNLTQFTGQKFVTMKGKTKIYNPDYIDIGYCHKDYVHNEIWLPVQINESQNEANPYRNLKKFTKICTGC